MKHLTTILFVCICLAFVGEAVAQQDTIRGTYLPYGKTPAAQRNDTIVKVKRMRPVPTSALGKVLHYLSPVKYDIVDSVYPVYTQEDEFYLHEDNHSIHNDFTKDRQLNSEQAWNQLYKIDSEVKKYPKDTTRELSRKVIGYHPYWMGSAYKNYNFNLLSRIVYFAYELNPNTGAYKDIHQWNETGLMRYAHQYGCKVDLSVTNFGTEKNTIFLKNVAAQDKLIKTLILLLRKRDGDGVNINFEAVPKNKKNEFTAFVQKLDSELAKVDSTYKITLTIPAIDWRNAYDVTELKNYVDYFFLMGYDFYGKHSKAAGPNALLFSGSDWTDNNINSTIETYIQFGAKPSSIVLGLPYYGHEWVTRDANVPSQALKYNGPRSYRYIMNNYADKYVARYDSSSHTMYYVFRDSTDWKQCWFDNEKTLAMKYDYINERRLGGVGIWALGYDNKYPELWNLLGQKFTQPVDTMPDLHTILSKSLEYSVTEKAVMEVHKTAPSFLNRFTERLSTAWKIFALFFAIILLFAVIGYIIAIADFDVRFVLFTKEVRVYLFFVMMAVILILIFRITDMLKNSDIVLIISLAIGVLAAIIVLNIGKMKKQRGGRETP